MCVCVWGGGGVDEGGLVSASSVATSGVPHRKKLSVVSIQHSYFIFQVLMHPASATAVCVCGGGGEGACGGWGGGGCALRSCDCWRGRMAVSHVHCIN